MVSTPAAMTAFSLGVGENVNKVILPPEAVMVRDRNPSEFERGLHEMRAGARKTMGRLAAASAAAGLPAWDVTKRSKGPP
jgi:hypothetical protein